MAQLVALHLEAAAPVEAYVSTAGWGKVQAEPSLGVPCHPASCPGLLTFALLPTVTTHPLTLDGQRLAVSLRGLALAPGHTFWPSSKPHLILVEELEKLRLEALLWGQKEASGTMPISQGLRDSRWQAAALTSLTVLPSEVFWAETVWATGGVHTCPSFVAGVVFAAVV